MRDRAQELADNLAICLDWLDNLELTVGNKVLVNHKPNNTPSRDTMRARIGQTPRGPIESTIELRAFIKEQRRLLRSL